MGVQMSDQWDDEEFETDNQQQRQPQGKGMRSQLEQALKENKALKTELTEAKANLRKEAVARVITAKGYKGKVAKLIPADVEPNEEAITKWLDEWADVFGGDNLKAEPETQAAQKPPAENSADDDLSNHEYAQKLAAVGRATGSAGAPMKDEDVVKRLQDPSLDRKGLLEMINAAGGGYGSG